ncbi:Uncharacterised protein [Candidatus Bilamarchaeum dharawalense]|uniref:Cupredoxin-like domain protein n=1 Tax=Candidatus Bilamarchaeum dharawalense TaxID=2885759 RepID=A0A5E4LL24_9ARCH|nr:Uncharacterised protein [Candidatus Bilamarchaeum dharawalense]
MDADILIILCNGALILALVVIVILIILNMKPFKCEKKMEGNNTCLTITAKRNIDRVLVKVWMSGDHMTFERKRIRKGQQVDFVFPTSKKPIRLTVEVEPGNQRTFEV